MKKIITVGDRIGKITILEFSGRDSHGQMKWIYKCDCGKVGIALDTNLKRDVVTIKSCGCAKVKHGKWRNRSYEVWAGMMKRCYNDKSIAYKHYGERGIYVCDRWHDFEKFLDDMGEKPQSMSIDRIDNNGPYSKENCRWATTKEQTLNRRSNRRITVNGETKTVSEWSECNNISQSLIAARIDRLGWNEERAVMQPVKSK